MKLAKTLRCCLLQFAAQTMQHNRHSQVSTEQLDQALAECMLDQDRVSRKNGVQKDNDWAMDKKAGLKPSDDLDRPCSETLLELPVSGRESPCSVETVPPSQEAVAHAFEAVLSACQIPIEGKGMEQERGRNTARMTPSGLKRPVNSRRSRARDAAWDSAVHIAAAALQDRSLCDYLNLTRSSVAEALAVAHKVAFTATYGWGASEAQVCL
jgi:hypothetical protein